MLLMNHVACRLMGLTVLHVASGLRGNKRVYHGRTDLAGAGGYCWSNSPDLFTRGNVLTRGYRTPKGDVA
jgi:hypothetical protein